MVSKYSEAKPLNVRMSENKYVESVEIKGENTAKTEVIFKIRNAVNEINGVRFI